MGLSQFDAGLFFDASQSADGDIAFRMRNSGAAFFHRMFELFVAANVIHFKPAIPQQRLDHFPAVHNESVPSHFFKSTHFIHTCQSTWPFGAGPPQEMKRGEAYFRGKGPGFLGPSDECGSCRERLREENAFIDTTFGALRQPENEPPRS